MKKSEKFFLAILILFFSACGKNITIEAIPEDPHNHSLLNKTLDEIRSEIAGKWQVQRGFTNGVAGPISVNIEKGKGDIYKFLFNDSVKVTNYSDQQIYLYDKATITKENNAGYNFQVYTYDFSNVLIMPMVMQEIKSDTLIIDRGFISGGGYKFYLIKKK